MSYAKHIETLEALNECECLPALTAAIELMRAAAPKDEAAERQAVERAAREWSATQGGVWSIRELIPHIINSRAAARAEGYARMVVELAAVKADHETKLIAWAALHHTQQTKLAEVQAEIERLWEPPP